MDRETLQQLKEAIEQASLRTREEIEAFQGKYLGRKGGLIPALFAELKNLPPEARKEFGQAVNELKRLAETRIREAREALKAASRRLQIPDLTLPGRRPFPGSMHPLTRTLQDIVQVFTFFGFEVAEGPEIEDDWHNFTALNFPPDHPARDMQDTFFLTPPPPEGSGVVLRTHTSPVQIRVMESRRPPIRIIAPGRVYRNEAISFKSYCLFHQVEGLYVDRNVTFADLKEILHVFAQALFGEDVRMRFRPSFFPFTEPSAEVDIWWPDPENPERGQWMEILGCGMVDPQVLLNVDIDPETYSGYAFGMGVERIAMLRYGIEDIRLFYQNDVRFLAQF